MVAELLRLRVLLLVNGLRRSRAALPVFLVGLAAVVFALVLGVQAAIGMRALDDPFLAREVALGGGLLVSLVFVVPALRAPKELIEIAALRGFGLNKPVTALTLAVATIIGPIAAAIPASLLPVVLWEDAAAQRVALEVAPIIVVQCVLLLRLGVSTGVLLRHHERARHIGGVIAVVYLVVAIGLLLLLALPRIVGLLPASWLPPMYPLLDRIGGLHIDDVADAVAAGPLAAPWAAPGLVANGHSADGAALTAGVSVIVLLGIWMIIAVRGFRPTWPTMAVRRRGVPGWFRLLPSGPLGAAVARSVTYWSRDPRYGIVFVLVPLLPVLILVPMAVAGVPMAWAAFIPLPLVLLLVAWGSLHNDVAYDSTAVWTLVAAQARGIHDRLGRAIPVAVIGVVLAAIGVPLSVRLQGDLASLPAFIGLSVAVLGAAIGVSSVSSVRAPYPTSRPGGSAFQQPENPEGTGTATQLFSLVLVLVMAAPAAICTVLWVMDPGSTWNIGALGAGAVFGVGTAAIGIVGGAAEFDRRTPELLAFAMRH